MFYPSISHVIVLLSRDSESEEGGESDSESGEDAKKNTYFVVVRRRSIERWYRQVKSTRIGVHIRVQVHKYTYSSEHIGLQV